MALACGGQTTQPRLFIICTSRRRRRQPQTHSRVVSEQLGGGHPDVPLAMQHLHGAWTPQLALRGGRVMLRMTALCKVVNRAIR